MGLTIQPRESKMDCKLENGMIVVRVWEVRWQTSNVFSGLDHRPKVIDHRTFCESESEADTHIQSVLPWLTVQNVSKPRRITIYVKPGHPMEFTVHTLDESADWMGKFEMPFNIP